ncbi:ATP-grasp domain-containing protein [Myxococcota bacterium]|nr:ATP-grasp domain-containing protein [Myxococcota bacterium]MBU1429545.1 ATP-grasp domain-containing protein [Myxococcota bacterium]MBU1896681.1 ATP-grasp domain-containing protein [Myxococcota bacterium]
MADPRLATVAVTGLNATDNPGPGMGVIRALRHNPEFKGKIVGLVYDTLEPGIYATQWVDEVYLIPYPSEGIDALSARLHYINEQVGIDAIIPTLDSELPAFIALEPLLKGWGIGMFLPSQAQFQLRSKARLIELGKQADIDVPPTQILQDVKDLYTIHETLGWPLVIKGMLYGATICRNVDEAVAAYHKVAAQWGYPILAQRFLKGEEFDVVAVGDGQGGLIGAVPMRKTFLTDKGKGWAGISIRDPALLRITERFMQATKWRGPCEVEILKSTEGYHLIEVNPRFPAWCYLSAGAGMNLPEAVLELSMGHEVTPKTEFVVGRMFVRISLDQIADIEDFQALTTRGELRRAQDKVEP